MDRDVVQRLTNGIFHKSLSVRGMLRGDRSELPALPLAEIVALADGLRELLTPEELAQGSGILTDPRWNRPTIELDASEGYARWADDYDEEPNPLIALEEPVVLGLVGDVADRDVLDAACGTGRYALRFARSGARLTGIDASEEMLAVARRKAEEQEVKVELRRADLARLPFPDASFDLAVCALALCHLPELPPAVGELARVLRPGGRLIISDFHPFCLLIGWRTAMRRPEATYCIENYLNMTQDYLRAVRAGGLLLLDLREAVVDESIASMLGEEAVQSYYGWPAALVISAEKGCGR